MAQARRILIDATQLRANSGQRGIGQMIANLLRGLAEIRGEWEGSLELHALADLPWGKAPLVSTDLRAVADEGLSQRGTAGLPLRSARRFRLPLVARDFDALHLPEIVGTPLSKPTPTIVTCHDLIPLRWPKEYLGAKWLGEIRRAKDRRRYHFADRIVCISPKTAQHLEELFGIGAPTSSVVWLGIELEAWRRRLEVEPRLTRLGLREGKYLVYAGYSDYRKNVAGMLGALAHARRAGLDLKLAWAGHLPSDRKAAVDRLANELGLTEHVSFLGYVDRQDLIALFQGALAHLFLSRLEGFGLSVAEAMAARCPVVVARGSGADDVSGSAALVVDPDAPEEAGQAIVRIANETGLADALRAAGEERSRLYDYRQMARGYVDVYRDVSKA